MVRGGDTYEISAQELVPGDIVVLESGDKVPADMRLLTTLDLEVDETLLTGASELVLFILALLAGLPLPLLVVQLLWLNLVTNGIQDVALAFEPAEGDELSKPPRPPREPIFNRLMIERVVLSALMIGIVAFLLFRYLLESGYSVDQARNGILLLMVLFENVHAFNSRSETCSLFRQNPLANPLLLFGVLGGATDPHRGHVSALDSGHLRS